MTDPTLYHEILRHQHIEYAVCDAERRICKHSPGLVTTLSEPTTGSLHGWPVESLFYELAGSETALEDVRRQEQDVFKVEKIFRTFADGQEGYLTLTIAPFPPGLLLMVTDVTAHGQLEQRVTQQRNDLSLMTHNLNAVRAKLDDILHRFVPGAVADQLIANPQAAQPGGERREATILFADLRGFTQWSEKQDNLETAFAALNSKLSLAAAAIIDNQGTLDKYLGDAVMGIFNAPRPNPDHALQAIKAAWQFTQLLRQQQLSLTFSVGINTGLTFVGNIGTAQAMNYTAIGDTVNQAKRLQEMARPNQILVSRATLDLIDTGVEARFLGSQTLRGKEQPVEVFEVVEVMG